MFFDRTIVGIGLAAVIALAGPASAATASAWTLTTGDLRAQSVAAVTVDGTGVQGVGWERFVSAERDGATPVTTGRFVLQLDSGERLVGSPAGIAGDSMRWQEPTVGVMTVPLQRLRSLTRNDAAAPAPGPAAKQDVVSLSNGDSVSGVFTGCTADAVTIQTDAGNTDVPLASVARITFAVTPAPVNKAAPADHLLRLRLADGSIFSGAEVMTQGDRCSLRPPGQSTAVSVPMEQVLGFEAVNGPVLWLADQTPVEATAVPFFGPVDGEPPASAVPMPDDAERLAHKLPVRAMSRLQFDVPAGWSELQTRFAIAAAPGSSSPWADVTVRIRLDGRVAFEQPHVRAGAAFPAATVPLGNAKRITLECDFGESAGVQGRLDWIGPALIRAVR